MENYLNLYDFRVFHQKPILQDPFESCYSHETIEDPGTSITERGLYQHIGNELFDESFMYNILSW